MQIMASCLFCNKRNLVSVSGETKTCKACDVTIYGGGTSSALKCLQCRDTYFHKFCLQNTEPVSFEFADSSERIKLSLVSVTTGGDPPKCQVCGNSMKGWSRYSTLTSSISVHPSCAINYIPTQNGSNQVPEQLRSFMTGHRHQDFDNMVIKLYQGMSPGGSVVECMICGKKPENPHVTAKWWYVMTRNGQLLGGCHVGCVNRQFARKRSSNRLTDLETYYDSIDGQRFASRIETAQRVLELAIGVTLTPPLSTVLIFVLKVMVSAVSIFIYLSSHS